MYKDKKHKLGWLILLISILVMSMIVFICVFSSCSSINFQKEIDSISPESNDIPYIASLGRLYNKDEIISIFNLCEKQNKDFESILCVYEDRIYFVYTDKTSSSWHIASIDWKLTDFEDHCQLNHPNEIYNRYPIPGDFENFNGYYSDGKIILNDHITILEYSLKSQTSTQYNYEKYEFPEVQIQGLCIGDESIQIKSEHWIKTFTLNEICQKSIGLSTIYSLKDRMNWEGESYITNFFDERSVQYIDDHIYVLGKVRNYHGQVYAIVMQYDETNDSWEYVTSIFTEDNGYCYIVPVA